MKGGRDTMPKMQQITPILRVRDIEASIAYYSEKLGFD
jgi:catechol 2,3-dioxygenase-like lactoylglutathione lyase family enzyme